ncbi:MAG TPA: hypothetical protein VHY48_12245 [Acidobacteriaceae bacterium]|jgi:hypothetical protein|nr:hypothetical protein [Acidobacteriaceae bacterium]
MASGGWPPAQEPAQGAAGQGVSPGWAGPAYELRPLSLGEILDRTFAVYRANFWLFVGISSLSGAVQLVSNGIQLLVYRGVTVHARVGAAALLERQSGVVVTGLLFFLAAAVTQAATVWALSEVYLGRRTTIADAVRAVIGRWLRFVGIGIWQGWSAIWLPLLLIVPAVFLIPFARPVAWLAGVLIFLGATGGVAFGAIAFLRNSLGVQAAVVERLKVRAAMRRSKMLTKGAKGRIFVIFLITWCLFMVAGVLQMPLLLVVGLGAIRGEQHVLAQISVLGINFVAHTLVTPVVLLGLSLVYFDQRVKQEGLDLLLMLGGGAEVSPATAVVQQAEANQAGPENHAATL